MKKVKNHRSASFVSFMKKEKQKNKSGSIFRALFVIFSFAGAVIMGYLLKLHYSKEESTFCNLGEGLSCDIVNKSLYSEILGVPISLLGFLYFLAVLGVAIFKLNQKNIKRILFISVAFLGPSLYFSYIEFFVIKNICVFCEASKVLILSVIVVSLLGLENKKYLEKLIGGAVLFAILFALATAFIQKVTAPGAGGKYNEFAQCLKEKNMIMYGSITCAFCARQRALFGEAFEFVEEIECDPRNPNNEAERCIKVGVERTPTWIMEDIEGNELYRFDPGVVPLERLGEVAGCELPE